MTADALTTTVSTKGQVILPKAVRDYMNWAPGTRLVVEHTADGVLLRPAFALFPPTRPEDVFGCLAYAGKAKTTDEMSAGIAVEAKRRHARSRY
jgi:AbrB family looped-hinge helix DNA binding protein